MAIAIYARKSIERENSISCETQIEYCKNMIKPDEKSEKIVTFVDNGFSGGNTERDGFQQMMKQIKEGKIKKVIVYRLDRISRSINDFVSILDTLKAYGVQFVSSQESFDTSTPYGEMIVKLLVVFAEFERKSIIERVTQAYSHRSELGIFMGGRKPYGFTFTDTEIHRIKTKMLIPVESEAEHIRYIFETYAVAGVSLRRVMSGLLKNGMQATSGSWSTAKLSAIIQNPIYVRADNSIYEYFAVRNCRIVSDVQDFDGVHGVQLYGKSKHEAEDMSDMKIVVMQHEGLIDAKVWLDCQKKLGNNKQIGQSNSNETSWLGGKVFCKKCGRMMRANKGSTRKDGSCTRYFSCTGKSHNHICVGVKVPMYAESLENTMYELITEKIASLNDVRHSIQSENYSKINSMKNRISEIKAEQAKLVDLLMNNAVASDMLKLLNERAKMLSEEQHDIYEKIDAMKAEESEILSVMNLSAEWKNASYDEKKSVAVLLIDKIYIDEDGSIEVVWVI